MRTVISRYKTNILITIFLAMLSVYIVKSLPIYYRKHKDQWRAVAKYIIQNCKEGDLIITDDMNRICVDYYLNQFQNSSCVLKKVLSPEAVVFNNIWVINYMGEYKEINKKGHLDYKHYSKDFTVLDKMVLGNFPWFYRLKRNLDGEEFHIEKEGEYILKAEIYTPGELDYTVEKIRDKKEVDFTEVDQSIGLWKLCARNCTYRLVNGPDTLIVSLDFDGPGDENEYLQMKRENFGVNLKEHPWIVLNYKLEDPDTQYIEIVAGIDIDNDGKVDLHIRGINALSNSNSWDEFRYNLLIEAIETLSGYRDYDLISLELYPHKKYGKDCSKEENKKDYTFYIKSLYLCDLDLFYKPVGRNGFVQFVDGMNRKVVFDINGVATTFRKLRDFDVIVPESSIVWKRVYLQPGEYNIKLANEGLRCQWLIVDKL